MSTSNAFEIFLVATPGHESALADEARACGFAKVRLVPGGVTVKGTWPEVWRANLELRGASRILARIASFRVPQMADLEKRARLVPWGSFLRPDVTFRVEATCRQSRIYHSGAAAERIEQAIGEVLRAKAAPEAPVTIKARIEDDVCTIAIDTSGEPLHKRGFKTAVAKAPMRETLAALFLRQCGYDGREPVLDPMCGSGTFVIEAAEMAAHLKPGRARSFAFEHLATFREASWIKIRDRGAPQSPEPMFHGRDRDPGAIRMSKANAERAGVGHLTRFDVGVIEDLVPPPGPPGLVITNPPYGSRIGDKRALQQLYRAFGEVMSSRFKGWRVGLLTADRALAKATGLRFEPPGAPVSNGGIPVTLYRTGPLP